MAKYRLRAKKDDSVITMLDVDTESRAWYIQADNKEAAIKALCDMKMNVSMIDHIYINGDEVTDLIQNNAETKEIVPEIKASHEINNLESQNSSLPEEENMPVPEKIAEKQISMVASNEKESTEYCLPTAEEVESALRKKSQEEAVISATTNTLHLPQNLPSVKNVIPQVMPSGSGKKEKNMTGRYLGKTAIKAGPKDISTIIEEADNLSLIHISEPTRRPG